MIINFIKKKILKSLAKDVAKALPELKTRALKLIEDNKDEVIAKIKAGITYYCNACPLDDKKINVISETIVEKGINKINPAVSKQLRK